MDGNAMPLRRFFTYALLLLSLGAAPLVHGQDNPSDSPSDNPSGNASENSGTFSAPTNPNPVNPLGSASFDDQGATAKLQDPIPHETSADQTIAILTKLSTGEKRITRPAAVAALNDNAKPRADREVLLLSLLNDIVLTKNNLASSGLNRALMGQPEGFYLQVMTIFKNRGSDPSTSQKLILRQFAYALSVIEYARPARLISAQSIGYLTAAYLRVSQIATTREKEDQVETMRKISQMVAHEDPLTFADLSEQVLSPDLIRTMKTLALLRLKPQSKRRLVLRTLATAAGAVLTANFAFDQGLNLMQMFMQLGLPGSIAALTRQAAFLIVGGAESDLLLRFIQRLRFTRIEPFAKKQGLVLAKEGCELFLGQAYSNL
jgi:hypothetical protein